MLLVPLSAMAAPYAAMVMDARTGKVLHTDNADTRLHPASLTKMMTLYIAFEAVENGELTMDTLVTVSRNAASEPPSKLGLREGQKIKLRYLVRAAAVKSANDAATAIGEAISGSEAAFARRMNRTAKAMGMTRTSFKNAHGLTENGHLSTARDMTILGRHVIYDYPQYYNLFSRITADAGVGTVSHTNRRLLSSYQGADGIKTGYTRAAGFNLVASAQRGNERVIATVFGGSSTASRNAKVAELLDLGFRKSPSGGGVRAPGKPEYQGQGASDLIADNNSPAPGARAKSIRVASAAVTRSLRPQVRPSLVSPADVAPLVAGVQDDIENMLKEVQSVAAVAPSAPAKPEPKTVSVAPAASIKPARRPQGVVLASNPPRAEATPALKAEVVTRLSTSGGRHWGINVGRYSSRFEAEKVMLKTALIETATLDGALRKVNQGKRGFDANFMGLTRDQADLACRRLQARQITCFMIGPS
ncbi:D-alanyl-D-alanine carboxypeptidase family protein [Tropicibacter oceani]|uniref:D-alanyl-D-alanine carboxypeptidase family protein n=1 Tax=Tropicibacter oceani TaxID=3058420 RepID=A0ABY8QMV2_9RHOB|nr:D-alanyl-D-alanine carboxypeptidase family protein [Tropicibacter oceani]WGW05346.1 D-alanyl-D-alanine carboxypeptidase family protein [Tropicibacter oceani]